MLSQEYEKMRADYMSHKITHQEYYMWVASKVHAGWNRADYFGKPLEWWVTKYAEDEHLNNTPMWWYDDTAPFYAQAANRAGIWWGLSDCTCMHKAIVKQKILDSRA